MVKTKTAAVLAAAGGLVLVRKNTPIALRIGDPVTTFRGEKYYLRSVEAPHHSGSTGRVYVSRSKTGQRTESYFPSVIDAEWMPEGVQRRGEKAALEQEALVHASQRCGAEPGYCMQCEDSRATLRVSVTSLEGEVLDYAAFCHDCAEGPLESLGLNPGKAQQIVAAEKTAKRIAKLKR